MGKSHPKVVVKYEDEIAIAVLTEERILEDREIQALEETFMPLIEQNEGLRLIIDFSEVRFLSSSVLGLLIRISKKIYEGEGQLRLCGIAPKIMEIFRITRLDRIFEIYDSQIEALNSLNAL